MINIKYFLIATNLIILSILLTIGLWPFEFKPVNNVCRSKDNKGILLIRDNLILEANNASNPGLLSILDESNKLTIEIQVMPYPASRNWLSGILTFYDDKDPELLMMAKWKSELIIRRRVQKPDGTYAYHEVGVTDVLFTGRSTYITITLDASGTTVYIDGKESAVFPRFIFNQQRENVSGARLMIGNDPRGRVPWEGEILGLAFYKSTLNRQVISRHYAKWQGHDYKFLARENDIIALYPMNERSGQIIRNIITNRNNLVIPLHLFAIKKSILTGPWINFWRDAKFYIDLAENILGFIPLGLFLPALFLSYGSKRRSLFYSITILIGSCISLTIELVQVYMPARTSSLTDLICNTLGTIIGVVLFNKVLTYMGGEINEQRLQSAAARILRIK